MVDIDVAPIYNRFLERREPLTKVINVFSNDLPVFQLLVGVGYMTWNSTSSIVDGGGNTPKLTLRGGNRHQHRCNIAVVLNHLGDMRILKNRNGRDFDVIDNFSVRLTILESLMLYGFNETDACIILGTFNGIVKEFIGPQPMIKYQITKHRLV